MYPTITNTTYTIVVPVNNNTNLDVGDIISFEVPEKYQIKNITTYLHRIVEKGIDKYGEYYIAKGDNNFLKDSIKIRRKNIDYVVIAILY